MNLRNDEDLLQPLHKMLVCLDLTEVDLTLIRYASSLAQTLRTEEVIFFHAIQAYDLPDRGSKDFPEIETELRGVIANSIQQTVDSHFENECKWEIVTSVVYENAPKTIIEYCQGEEVDLVLIGQKYGEDREARYGHKITAQVNSDVLFVPQDTKQILAPILCAIDFSDASIKAFERALDISRSLNVQLICYSISDPARAYFPASTERSSNYDKERSRKAFEKFLMNYDVSTGQVAYRIGDAQHDGGEATNIYTAADGEKASLIVVGATGETGNVTSLLGHLYESFRLMEKRIPVMIVKHESKRQFPWFWKKE